MNVDWYYIVFKMRNESTMVNIKTYSEVLLFYIAVHDPQSIWFYLTT